MMRSLSALFRTRPLLWYVLLAYGLSWLAWTPLILGHLDGRIGSLEEGGILLVVGTFGPSLSALFLSGMTGGRVGIQQLFKRMVIWRVASIWYFFALYSFLLLFIVPFLFYSWSERATVLQQLLIGFLALPLVGLTANLWFGPLGEEIGWRGFALPHLLRDRSPVSASLILGLIWAFWHTPILVVFADFRYNKPLLLFFAGYVVSIVALAIIFTWFHLSTKGSLLIALLFHTGFNTTFDLFDFLQAEGIGREYDIFWWTVVMTFGFALVLVIVLGARLHRQQ